ncbi:MAG: inorganic phosphate transporter [Oligoflexia bacterium]|nr:inorganic phosphate transporter [Oligoflexia bacterium]
MITTTLIIFICIALLFDFLNGFNDSANIVSTMISSRALSPRKALTITAIAEFLGPFIFGVAIAKTIGAEILILPPNPAESLPLILAALMAAVCWNLTTWYFGIPSSSSHALIGGMVGAGIADSLARQLSIGFVTAHDFWNIFRVIRPAGLIKTITALLISPLLGFFAGFLVLRLWRFLARGSGPGINFFFRKGQVATAIGLALSHGTNDAQKTMGVITMGLVASGVLTEFQVPFWVVALSAGAISAGTAVGGWRLIRTLGGKFYKIRPIDGFSTQIAAGSVILGAALLGGPVSTTQVVTAGIMGVGSAERLSKVRWGVSRQIVLTWIITIPATSTVAALIFFLIRRFV